MRCPLVCALALALFATFSPFSSAPAAAQSASWEEGPDNSSLAALAPALAPPLRLAESRSPAPLIALRSAAVGALDQLEALAEHNRSGQLPVQIGFARPLPATARKVQLTAELLQNERIAAVAGGFVAPSLRGGLVWGTHVGVAGADRLRLHLTDLDLPAGTRLWVWGLGEEPQAFGLELAGPDGDLWTPSVGGESIVLEMEIPAGGLAGNAARFQLREVGQSFRLGPRGEPLDSAPAALDTSCLDDATCVTAGTLPFIGAYRRAVAHLRFIDGGNELACSGGLVADTVAATSIPYLLTANHCFDDQAAAATLEAFWNYRTATCNGTAPALSSLPKSNGATLLASNPSSDFTFVRLNSIPANRAFLSWTLDPLPNNTPLYRISHPLGGPQAFSRSTLRTSGVPVCAGTPRPRFLYSQVVDGATFGSSSGAPVVTGSGQIVGQLTGGCGSNPDEGCDSSNSEIDGAFATTFTAISQYLNPATPRCQETFDTVCLADDRFQVRVTFQPPGGSATPAAATRYSSLNGLFIFFDPNNLELLVKVLNACNFSDHIWVFAAGLTNVRVVITVTDTVTGRVKTYINPQGSAFAPIQDTAAFPCP